MQQQQHELGLVDVDVDSDDVLDYGGIRRMNILGERWWCIFLYRMSWCGEANGEPLNALMMLVYPYHVPYRQTNQTIYPLYS